MVLNEEDYNQKMNNLLKDASYRQLKNNPTTKFEKKVADALKKVERWPVQCTEEVLDLIEAHNCIGSI